MLKFLSRVFISPRNIKRLSAFFREKKALGREKPVGQIARKTTAT